MHSLVICIFSAPFLLSGVEAHRTSGVNSFHFDAPPLVDGILAVNAFLLFATIAQLALATSYLFRARTAHRAVGIGAVLALVVLTIEYSLGIVLVVEEWSFDDFGFRSFTRLITSPIDTAETFFWELVDPMMFAAIALVLRNRCLTYVKENIKRNTGRAGFLLPFTIASCIFFGVMLSLVILNVTLYGVAHHDLYNGDIPFSDFDLRIHISYDVLYAFIAVDSFATLFLIAFAAMVKKLTKTDKITTLTLTIIIPLLTLRIISRIVFAILNARLVGTALSIQKIVHALRLSDILVHGVLYLAIASVLIYFLIGPGVWDVAFAGTETGMGVYNAPHDGSGASPSEEKAPDGALHPYANQDETSQSPTP